VPVPWICDSVLPVCGMTKSVNICGMTCGVVAPTASLFGTASNPINTDAATANKTPAVNNR